MSTPFTFSKSFTPPHELSGRDPTEPILTALSGGADSSALLYMLWEYGKQFGAKIYAAHVNHCIRGEEADRDEEFCKRLCEKLDIPLFTLRADVPRIAAETGESIETAARRVRYSFFSEQMKAKGIRLLATAHNANDNLETMLFNLARGTSLSGMCGIPSTRPCEGGTVIRPILYMEKSEILRFCRENSLDFVTDSTNTDTDYTRNMIRAEIVPKLLEINSGAVRNSARLSEELRADALCLESMKDMFLEGICDECSVETEKLLGSPRAIGNRALVSLYRNISEATLEKVHIDALRDLAAKGVPHSSLSLPDSVEAVIENSRLMFRRSEQKKEYEPYCIPLFEGRNDISQTNCEIFIGYSQKIKNIYKNSILIYIDSATISGSLSARSRSAGDRILAGGMHKSVKKLMCDKKIPLGLRSRLPIICDDKGIVAIPSVALRDGAKPKDNGEYISVLVTLR